jgi:branched-chain amino acid transport system permease protein
MFYRENGQFKTTYRADQQVFPILQDRVAIWVLLAAAFAVVPLLASDYLMRAILIPFLIMSLAALGVNVLVGYCGQISLGSGAFMAVGAYGAYNIFVRIPGMPLIPALLLGGLCATAFGILFGLPSLRVKGLYLAVATLAAQFFSDWMFLRIKWFTLDTPSGSVSVSNLQVFGLPIESAASRYVFCLAVLVVMAVLTKNLVRGAIGREWMAIRDMDVAAAVIGIRPMHAKLGAWEPAAFSVDLSFRLLFMVIIGGLGSIMGSFFGAAFIIVLPVVLNQVLPALAGLVGAEISTVGISHAELMLFGGLIVWFLIVEPHGLARLWSTGKQKLRTWPFPY